MPTATAKKTNASTPQPQLEHAISEWCYLEVSTRISSICATIATAEAECQQEARVHRLMKKSCWGVVSRFLSSLQALIKLADSATSPSLEQKIAFHHDIVICGVVCKLSVCSCGKISCILCFCNTCEQMRAWTYCRDEVVWTFLTY